MAASFTFLDDPLVNANPIQAFKRFWAKAFIFDGRASRSEYWWMALCHTVVYIAIWLFTPIAESTGEEVGATAMNLLYVGYLIVIFVPQLALTVRRLHDANQSGWLSLTVLIPVVGPVIFLLLMLMSPRPEGARYG